MIRFVKGDLLEAKEEIVVHQVNVQGIMGGGLAKQLADRYKGLEEEYRMFCKIHNNDYDELKGEVLILYVEGKIIANMFSQKTNFETDYNAMEKGLKKIKEFAKTGQSIAMPKNIGNGIANGVEGKAEKIAMKTFNDDIEMVLYEYETIR